MNCPHDVYMTDFKKKLRKNCMSVGIGVAGVAAAAPIFLPIKKSVYKKNENEKKDEKFVFSCNCFCQIHRCHLR